jgi:hypothetical protein
MRRRRSDVTPDGVPTVLVDRDAPVWHDQAGFLDYMEGRGWPVPARDRFGAGAHPDNRRRAAVYGWAADAGLVTTHGSGTTPLPDGPRLASMGLLELWGTP